MATIDKLLADQKTAQTEFEKQVKAGESAQASLAQVRAALQDLADLRKRKVEALAGADGRNAEIDAAVKVVDGDLAPIDPWLTTATVRAFDEVVTKTKMVDPLDKDKTYPDYVEALATAQGTLAKAIGVATAAGDAAKQRLAELDGAQGALKAAVDAAANAASAAKAASGDAKAAMTANDQVKVYMARARAIALKATVSAARAAVGTAKSAFETAVDAYATAADDKSKADAKVAAAQTNLATAKANLDLAAAQVTAAVAAPAKATGATTTGATTTGTTTTSL